jgi:Cys-rich repeat protein
LKVRFGLLAAAWGLLGCEPQEVHLFTPARANNLDAGTPPRAEVDAGTPAPPPATGTPEQPACRSAACRSCVAQASACLVADTQWLCHPSTGKCSLPCDPTSPSSQCPPEQRCHPDDGLCVDCVGGADCSGVTAACDTERNVCVECTSDATCSAPTPACDTDAQRCVPCIDNRHCATGQVCNAAHTCVQCVVNDDCLALPGDDDRRICDTANQICVECLSSEDCNEPDKPFCKQSEHECDDEN